jgi:hypothetical protein
MSGAIDAIIRSCRESAAVARRAADRLREEFPLRENEISTSPALAEASTETAESHCLSGKPWEAAGIQSCDMVPTAKNRTQHRSIHPVPGNDLVRHPARGSARGRASLRQHAPGEAADDR